MRRWRRKKKKTHTKRLWELSPSVVELYKTHLSSETSGAGGGGGGSTSSSTNNNNNIVLDLGSGLGLFYLSRIQRFHRTMHFDSKSSIANAGNGKTLRRRRQSKRFKMDARDDDAFLRALSVVGDVSRLKLVLGVRFCHKPLFAQIAKHLPRKSDCLFAWFHFAKGCELSKSRPTEQRERFDRTKRRVAVDFQPRRRI